MEYVEDDEQDIDWNNKEANKGECRSEYRWVG